MTTEALRSLETIPNADAELKEIVVLMTNLFTIRLALEQCPDFPYVKNIRDANDVAVLAAQAKLQLYFDSQTK